MAEHSSEWAGAGNGAAGRSGSGATFLAFVAALGTSAYFFPAPFAAGRDAIGWLLSLVMLGMGLTLTPEDFRRVAERPAVVGIGAALQFTVMPLAAWGVSALLGLPPEAALGMILVGACPGGTASNVICFLARADVALSVTLTGVSTLLAPLLTPALTSVLAGRIVDVPTLGLFASVAKIVLAPVLAGIVLRRVLGGKVERILPALAPLTGFVIALIIAIIVGAVRPNLGAAVLPLVPAVVLHNLIGMTLGYAGAKLLRYPERIARTLAVEVGMQNSGLAVALASKFFVAAAALPGALFSVWHNLSGAAAAAYWSGRPSRPE